jgi:hypothetical protein
MRQRLIQKTIEIFDEFSQDVIGTQKERDD